jgi:hypothetical protein
LTTLCLFVIVACSDPVTAPYEPLDVAAQQAYFPLEIGKFTEYRVDSIVYDFGPGGSTVRDSTLVYVREEIADTIRDNSGELLFVLERSERRSDTLPWTVRQVWSASRNATQAIRSENNLRFLRLVFPFDDRTRWNGNLWIDPYQSVEIAGELIQPFVNWNYRVDAYDFPAQVGAFSFDSVLVVTEVDQTNAIERRLSRAWYAKHIGLVRREQQILDSQYCNQIPAPADCLSKPWTEKAQKGYLLHQVLLNHN